MKKVIVLSTLVAVCLSVVPVHASGQGREDGCRTFNLWAHEPATDETDYLSCGIAELEHERKVKHSDTTPEPIIAITESPVAPPVVTFTPEPPIVCENDDDDEDNDGDECEGDATDDDDTHEP